MADKEIKEGDQVSWQWSGSRPGGEVEDVKEKGEMKMETKSGNEVKKNADPENPAVKVKRSGHDVVKKASELEVDEEGDKHKEAQGEEKTVGADDDEPKENGDKEAEKDDDKEEAETGDKRKADEPAEKRSSDAKIKKQKTAKDKQPVENGNGSKKEAAPKKKGRPAKKDANGASAAKDAAPAKASAKKREPKKAATESGEPRRSGRHANKS